MTKKSILFILSLLFTLQVIGQINHSEYFTVTENDKLRWDSYNYFIKNSTLPINEKADSLYTFAKNEYDFKQFSKTRELCELSLSFNPQLAKAHLLIGKAYASSSRICKSPKSLNFDIIWAAIDQWEFSLQDESTLDESQKLIERYSVYLPQKHVLLSCFDQEQKKYKEGDKYPVGCWIQRDASIKIK